MIKLRIKLVRQLPLYLLLIGLLSMYSCKNKKKLSEVSDTEEVKAQIEQELATEDNEEHSEDVGMEEKSPVKLESNVTKELSKSQQLDEQLKTIASAESYAVANRSINQTLEMFSSPAAPVLIIIYENGPEVEYDEPTTIGKYLNYLKDTKNQPATVVEMGTNPAGKITELVLRKK